MLFDVDGTLLLTHDEVYVEASRLALEAVFGSYPDALKNTMLLENGMEFASTVLP